VQKWKSATVHLTLQIRNEVSLFVVSALIAVASTGCSSNGRESITQQELARRTQELLDGVTAGDRRPFERYFAEDSLIHDEKGRSMDKRALVADITPPPPDWSGGIKLGRAESIIVGDTAIFTYDLDETETISGQTMYARYHTTDTWLRRDGEWRIAAEQALRYYADPAAGRPDTARYPEYVGTYELSPGKTCVVTVDGAALYSEASGKAKVPLISETGDMYFRKDVEGRVLFRRDAQGKVDALIDRRNNEDIVWRKVR
jgi:hypothetical protein